MENCSELLKKVEIAVRAAAKVINADFTVEQKSTASDIVTSCDIEIQQFLCRELKKLLPACGFLCEEKDMRDLKHEYVWIIDPIDGTSNFSRGYCEYAISVALVRNMRPLLSVVYNPVKNDCFTAIDGEGAKLNGKSISVSQTSFEKSLLCTAMSLYNKDFAPVCMDIISDAYMQCNDIRRLGSAALEICYLAAGKFDLYFEIRVFPWDYAGAYLILKEAGGILKGWNGEDLAFEKATVLVGANNADNYEKLNSIVNKHLKSVPYEEYM